MVQAYQQGQTVQWQWGQGTGEGKVEEIYTDKISKTIKGANITRNASTDEPAYLLKQKDGDEVLKSHSELEPVD